MTKSRLFGLVWCPALVCFVWWAVTTDQAGPGNIIKLLAALDALLLPVAAYGAAKLESKDPRPEWLLRLFDVADILSTLILAWFGWWWCSVGFAIGAFGGSAMRHRTGKAKAV